MAVGRGPGSPRSCPAAGPESATLRCRLVLAQRQRRDDRHHLDRGVRCVQSACAAVEYACGRACHAGVDLAGSTGSTRNSPANGCCRCAPKPGTATSMTSTAAMCGPSTPRPRSTAPRRTGAEGSVGGGTGMNCYGFKGGNGTASRLVRFGATPHCRRLRTGELRLPPRTHGRRASVGPRLADDNPLDGDWFERDLDPPAARRGLRDRRRSPPTPRCCPGSARRSPGGCRWAWPAPAPPAAISPATSSWPSPPPTARIWPAGSRSARPGDDEFGHLKFLPWGRMDDFYAAVVHSVEEAVLNALVVNADMVGRDGHRSPALPHDQLRALL